MNNKKPRRHVPHTTHRTHPAGSAQQATVTRPCLVAGPSRRRARASSQGQACRPKAEEKCQITFARIYH